MKLKTLLKCLAPILLSSSAFSQDLYTYELFNNKFQAVFPSEPSLQSTPDGLLDPKRVEGLLPPEYKKTLSPKQLKNAVSEGILLLKKNKTYFYNDSGSNLRFTSSIRPSGLTESNYKHPEIKKMMDQVALAGLSSTETPDAKLINWSSIYNRDNSTHIALYTFSFFIDGIKIYCSKKNIFHKEHIYQWSVYYRKLSDRSIFENYQEHAKVLK